MPADPFASDPDPMAATAAEVFHVLALVGAGALDCRRRPGLPECPHAGASVRDGTLLVRPEAG